MEPLRITTGPSFKPEKEYAFLVFIGEILGLEYQLEYQDIQEHVFRLPNGAEWRLPDQFKEIQEVQTFGAQLQVDNPASFDPFAATFLLLTRLEEQNSTALDEHGRFPAQASWAWQKGFLHRPVIQEWADWFWDQLQQKGWDTARKTRKFKFSLSCDVDHPLLWWSKMERLKTILGAVLHRGDFLEAAYWVKNYSFNSPDPYDVFDEWLQLFRENDLTVQFNFLGKRPKSSNCWYPLEHPVVRALLDKIAKNGHNIGFHPSYEAYEDASLFEQELASLRAVSPLEIISGRQHYLRFSSPETWQMWENAGLREDSTLGYPEALGFRAGISQDYPVFDTQQRKILQLREKPLIAMDVSLALYQKCSPEEAITQLLQLYQTVAQYQGNFSLLWHNSSWNSPFWENWKKVFYTILQRANS